MSPRSRTVLAGASLATGFGVALATLRGADSPALALPWLFAAIGFAAAADNRGGARRRMFRASAILPVLFAAALPVLVRVANLDSRRAHGDEFLTAYFSAHHDFAHTNPFALMPEKWEWPGQFPAPFFFLERVFFSLFGQSMLTLRLAVLIYPALVSVMLYLAVREFLGRGAALAAVVLNAFLAVGVYLETLGLHFVSSTAALMTFFYFAVRVYRTSGIFPAAMAGITCGLCYLTYFSSYIALPLMAGIFGLQLLRERKLRVLENLVIVLAGMLLVLAPFLAYAIRSRDFVWARVSQVSLLTGEWSPFLDAIAGGASKTGVVGGNLMLSLRSFVLDGIGGHGGYDFGRLAFFDRFSLVLFLAGLIASLFLLRRKHELLFVLVVIAASFFTGVVMTIPPPAYHRFSAAFPFLAIVMAIPLWLLLRVSAIPRSVRYAAAAGLLGVFAALNQRHLVEAVVHDPDSDELQLAALLNARYAGRKVYVAAFDAFAFQRIFYFLDTSPGRKVQTGFHDNLLRTFNREEKYVYVMILGDAFREKFQKADPAGRYSRFSQTYSLFANR